MNVTYTGEFSRVKELKTVTGPGITQLVDRCGMTEEEANQLGEVLMVRKFYRSCAELSDTILLSSDIPFSNDITPIHRSYLLCAESALNQMKEGGAQLEATFSCFAIRLLRSRRSQRISHYTRSRIC